MGPAPGERSACSAAARPPGTLIEVGEAFARWAQRAARFVDVQDQPANAVPGSVSLPELFDVDVATRTPGAEVCDRYLRELVARAGLGGDVVVYEHAMHTGAGRSFRAHMILRQLGVASRVLHGGLAAWSAAGHPIGAPAPGAAAATGTPATGLVWTTWPAAPGGVVALDRVRDASAHGDAQIVDVRGRDEWFGRTAGPSPVANVSRTGRIPGAIWMEWTRFLDMDVAQPRLKSPQSVRAMCEAENLDLDRPIYLYCYKGARASLAKVALDLAGAEAASVYLGSWLEWASDPSSPVEVSAEPNEVLT